MKTEPFNIELELKTMLCEYLQHYEDEVLERVADENGLDERDVYDCQKVIKHLHNYICNFEASGDDI